MIQAVFIDIDGTLINSQKNISENTKNVIKRCIEKNIKIILASGRSRNDTLKYQSEIKSSPYIISSNGADSYDIEEKKEICSEPIPKKVANKLLLYAQKHNCKINLNYDDKVVMNISFYPDEKDKERTNEELMEIILKEKIVQCVILSRELEKIKEFKTYLQKEIPEVKIENQSKRLSNPESKPSSSYYCDITSSRVSKGNAVEQVCEYLNVKKENIVVIGDGENDITMFEKTSNSVAMGNATEKVKRRANYITDTNDEEGVANFLERILKE